MLELLVVYLLQINNVVLSFLFGVTTHSQSVRKVMGEGDNSSSLGRNQLQLDVCN